MRLDCSNISENGTSTFWRLQTQSGKGKSFLSFKKIKSMDMDHAIGLY